MKKPITVKQITPVLISDDIFDFLYGTPFDGDTTSQRLAELESRYFTLIDNKIIKPMHMIMNAKKISLKYKKFHPNYELSRLQKTFIRKFADYNIIVFYGAGKYIFTYLGIKHYFPLYKPETSETTLASSKQLLLKRSSQLMRKYDIVLGLVIRLDGTDYAGFDVKSIMSIIHRIHYPSGLTRKEALVLKKQCKIFYLLSSGKLVSETAALHKILESGQYYFGDLSEQGTKLNPNFLVKKFRDQSSKVIYNPPQFEFQIRKEIPRKKR